MTFPWKSHFNLREAAALELIRDTCPDHRLMHYAYRRKLLQNRTTGEIIAYLARNPRRERSAA